MIEPALAIELHLSGDSEASVRSAGVRAAATVTQADLVEVGTHQVAGLKVVVFDIGIQQGQTRDLRGVLGEDFLGQFDLLIDNAHSMVCLDETGRMRAEAKGRRVALLTSGAGAPAHVTTPVVAVRLSDGMRPVRLELDSGADVSFLFDTSFLALGVFKLVPVPGSGASGASEVVQDRPGSDRKHRVYRTAEGSVCYLFDAAEGFAPVETLDGLLPSGLFKRVLISRAENFVILER